MESTTVAVHVCMYGGRLNGDRHGGSGPGHSKHWQFPQTEGPRMLFGVDDASAALVLLGGTRPGIDGVKVE